MNGGFYDFSGLSFRGRREINEDSIVCLKFQDNFWLLAVADGVGGEVHGEFASSFVISAITDYLNIKAQKEIKESQLKQLLSEVFEYAQFFLKEKKSEMPWLSGMKTTLSILLLFKNKYVCGNIGDSPAFLFSNNKIKKLIQEHTFNNESNFPNKTSTSYNFNVLTKVVDGGSDKPDIYPDNQNFYKLSSGQTIALCSDGIYSDTIKNFNHYRKILKKNIPVEKKNIELIEKAYNNKSTDNISVILLEAKNKLNSIKNPRDIKNRLNKKYVLLLLISITIILLIILLLDITGYYPINQFSSPVFIKDSVFNQNILKDNYLNIMDSTVTDSLSSTDSVNKVQTK